MEDSGNDFSNFNTATDVENALKDLAKGGKPEVEEEERAPIQLSKQMAESQALREEKREFDISGDNTEMVFGLNPVDGTTDRDGLGEFVFRYKQKVKDLLAPVAPKPIGQVTDEENVDPNLI